MNKLTGGPAFPIAPAIDPHTKQAVQWPSDGMTLRDYFAAKAMQGEIANCGADGRDEEVFASWCYKMADAMLAERDK